MIAGQTENADILNVLAIRSSERANRLGCDVSKAYFCAPATKTMFVELPPEDSPPVEDMVAEMTFFFTEHAEHDQTDK